MSVCCSQPPCADTVYSDVGPWNCTTVSNAVTKGDKGGSYPSPQTHRVNGLAALCGWSMTARHMVQTCEDLDRRAGIAASVLWPMEPQPAAEEGESEKAEAPLDPALAAFLELPVPERLQLTLVHLRQAYQYCLFCGHQVGRALKEGWLQRPGSLGCTRWSIR